MRLLSQAERIIPIELMVSGQENTVIKHLRTNGVHIAIKSLLPIKHQGLTVGKKIFIYSTLNTVTCPGKTLL
tara:strand:- start:772 stop:987 length:216 start_codon:yes stop_codon:yes gene_type:complete